MSRPAWLAAIVSAAEHNQVTAHEPMFDAELEHMTLLAEVDSLTNELQRWSARAPDWPPAKDGAALIARLSARADAMKVRIEAPLVVATLGGTGTGKSALVNAICGEDVTEAGRQRPTTRRPVVICRPGLRPEVLGIDPEEIILVQRDLPVLRDLVLVDCPDPDTTELEAAGEGTNLARLRELVPHCDVLLVTSTQQKYRSARVLEELATAAPGARLVFVQTHADTEADIRDDWRSVLDARYATGDMFYIDSIAAFETVRSGAQPRGEFARLLDLLIRELSGAAQHRIRKANFIELVEASLAACRERLDQSSALVEQIEAALVEQRGRLATKLSVKMRSELLAGRRQWESRLLGQIASQWGFSPFSALLRIYQGLGGLVSSAALLRARTPAQLALWGAMESHRRLKRHRQSRHADQWTTSAAAWTWDETDLRTASIILEGYVSEAGLPRHGATLAAVTQQATQAARSFVAKASAELQSLVERLAQRHTGWFTRLRYEFLLCAMLGIILYRLGRNFFYDSWLAPQPQALLDSSFFISAAFWLILWSTLLLWAFTSRLRRGLKAEIVRLTERWDSPAGVTGLFAEIEQQCRAARDFSAELERIDTRVRELRKRMELPTPRLGHRLA